MTQGSDDGKWYQVSLRLMGDGLPIDEIEDMLGLVPKVKKQIGSRLGATGEARTNVWVWSPNHDTDVAFEVQIADLLEIVEPKKDRLLAILEIPGVEAELFLGYGSVNGQGGAYISAEILRRIADCGLAMSLDLYPPPGSSED